MEKSVNLTAKEILDKKFTKNVKGYDPVEVDSYLDRIIHDYQVYAALLSEKNAKISALEKELRAHNDESASSDNRLKALREQVKQLEIENASLKNKLDGIKPGDKVNSENMEWIQRCRKLENFLYQHGFSESDLR